MNQVTAGNYLGQRLRRTKGVEPKGSTLCADESSGLCCPPYLRRGGGRQRALRQQNDEIKRRLGAGLNSARTPSSRQFSPASNRKLPD